jgi:hypothetical protein
MNMENFPAQIRSQALRNGTLKIDKEETFLQPTVMKNETDVREALRAIPNREKYLSLLALIATSSDESHVQQSDLESYVSRYPAPNSEQISFLAKLTRLHGHSTTFTVAAIHSAYSSAYFDRSFFLLSREEDPQFWAFLLNYGRPKMPASVFGPYALFAAERALGEPIHDLTKIAHLLVPSAETA